MTVISSGDSTKFPPGYRALQSEVRSILSEGLERAQRVVERERIRTYWELGSVLDIYLAEHGSGYGGQVFKLVATDCGLTDRLLYDIVSFRRSFTNSHTYANLTWSHYRRVLALSVAERDYYLRAASDRGWTVREMEAQIKSGAMQLLPGETTKGSKALEVQAKRGELFTYRIVVKNGEELLDLGCRTYRPIEAAWGHSSEGDLLRSVPDRRTQAGYRLELAESRRRLYTFVARATKIIDGDTLWAMLDLGFDTFAERKLRLRGIDTPEMDSVAGRQARTFLVDTLAEVSLFVVTTTKVDLYDRYLADLFVLPGEPDPAVIALEGGYLNREMVKEGVARVWEEEKPEF